MSTKDCIYCKAALTATTRKAHVWPASMGGRLWSRAVCCDDCNNAISTAEDNLRASLSHVYASVGATNDDRDAIEVSIEVNDRDFALSDGFADMQVAGSRFDRDTKSMVVPLPAGLDDQAEKLAKAMWSHGLGPDDVDKLQLTPGDPEPVLPEGPTRHEHDLNIGSVVHKQVFVKMAMELLALHRHDHAMRGELSEARRFARYGSGEFRAKLDARSQGSGLIAASVLPEVFNAIEVWTFGKSVFFRAVFLGPIVFTGTLTTTWLGDPFRAAYAFDARDPAKAIANTLVEGDGQNLAIWIDDMRDETIASAVSTIEAISLKLAQARSQSKPQREAPPEIADLRAAVRARLAAMPPRKKKRT